MVYLPVSKHLIENLLVSTVLNHVVDMVLGRTETKIVMKGGIHNDS